MNFGGIPEDFAVYEKSSICVLPVPYDATSTWMKGADNGPAAILEASANMELYDIETAYSVYEKGIYTCEPLVSDGKPEEMISSVCEKLSVWLNAGKFPVIIGGNHSVSIGAFKAFSGFYNDLTILQLDAHADLRQSYEESENNHACVMARARELCPVVQVGIRSMSNEEINCFEKDRMFFAHELTTENNWQEKVIGKLSEYVYLTIDLDVFDPSIMPSTGTPEPGGLGYYGVLELIRKLIDKRKLVGMDVVELCPNHANKAPDFLASKLIYQILSYRFKK